MFFYYYYFPYILLIDHHHHYKWLPPSLFYLYTFTLRTRLLPHHSLPATSTTRADDNHSHHHQHGQRPSIASIANSPTEAQDESRASVMFFKSMPQQCQPQQAPLPTNGLRRARKGAKRCFIVVWSRFLLIDVWIATREYLSYIHHGAYIDNGHNFTAYTDYTAYET